MKQKLLHAVCLSVLMSVSKAHAYDNRPIVVMRQDDCRATCRDAYQEFGNKSFLEYGKELRIPVTWGVITNQTDTGENGALGWAELVDYITTAGGELASHSATHAPMSSLQAYVNDVMLSKATIESKTPFVCNTFLQPGTWLGEAFFTTPAQMNNILGQLIKNSFSQSQMYLGKFEIGPPVLKHGLSANFGIDQNFTPVLADFLKVMDYVSETPACIYTIQFHGIQPSTASEEYSTRVDFMAGLLTRLNELRNNGSIRLLSINDAYNNNQFSSDFNRVSDPGFEYTAPELAKYLPVLWQWYMPETIVEKLGYNGSSCARLVSGNYIRQGCYLPSGKYKLSWKQKPDVGTSLDRAITPRVSVTSPWSDVVSSPRLTNSTNAWEEKSLLFRMPATGRIRINYASTDAFLIDDISAQLVTPSSESCITELALAPMPDGIILRWRSPDDPSYSKVELRYSLSGQCPQKLSEGSLVKRVDAVNGSFQSYFFPFNWASKYYFYVSAFAVKADNTFSEPDVNHVLVDSAKPVVAINLVSRVGNAVDVSWKSTASASSIFTSYYAVGTAPSAADIIGWTECKTGSAELHFSHGKTYYLSVKSQNVFGVWSDNAEAKFVVEQSDLAKILRQQDGDPVAATGIVSAVFADGYYIETANRTRGIRVVGSSVQPSVGMSITVEGVLKADAGERYIQTQTP